MNAKDPVRVIKAEFLFGGPRVDSLPAPTLGEIAFAGRSNVGKSSLLNRLMARKNLARTSGTPGCTRQLNVFGVTVVGASSSTPWMIHFVDLPGYGYAKRSKSETRGWGEMIEGYLLGRATLRAVCVLFDIRRGPEDEEKELFEFLRQEARVPRPPIVIVPVATKVDKLSQANRKPALARTSKSMGKTEVPPIAFSAETGDGEVELWSILDRAVRGGQV